MSLRSSAGWYPRTGTSSGGWEIGENMIHKGNINRDVTDAVDTYINTNRNSLLKN